MARQETKYIVIHCSQTRPSQKDVDAKWIDRIHRERGWLKIGYAIVITRKGEIQRGREDDEVQAAVKGYNHTSFNLCLVGGAKEEEVEATIADTFNQRLDGIEAAIHKLANRK